MMYSGKYEMLVFIYLKFQVFDLRVFILLETGLFLSESSPSRPIWQPKGDVLKMRAESSSFQAAG